MMNMHKIEVKVDVTQALYELDSFKAIMRHYDAIPILIEAVRELPNSEEILAKWDKARSPRPC